ncbi:MAG: hypothetical protein FXF47_02645 [Candidatus Mcinerneyibacterium aminivorans]|uniref:Translocation and assembly module TamB C-terminal domain-containing protein n=1 Tax=Candidatus Mcinerneyibacterium aminivorans TaxID=2703815 RepID=A0A5D0MMH5_9BACT|nr:MAG: hypothetical protein FXF47_02645 [Candidatus Mcinerneyibacterium aminivorans]
MKKILRTIFVEIFISILIFLTIIFFITYMNIDDYLTDNYLSLILKKYNVKIDKNNIDIRFPFKLELSNISIGGESTIKEASVIVSPLSFFYRNKINIIKLDVHQAIIYKNDILNLFENKKDGTNSLNFKISSLNCNDLYFVYNKDFYVKFEKSNFQLEKEYKTTVLEINHSNLSYRNNKLKIYDSIIKKENKNITINVTSDLNQSVLNLNGRIKDKNLNIDLNLKNYNLNNLSNKAGGEVSIYGKIMGDLSAPKFSGFMSLLNGNYKNIIVNDGNYNLFLSSNMVKVSDLNVQWKDGNLSGNLNYFYKGENKLEGNFNFHNINISELFKNMEYTSSLDGEMNFSGRGTNWSNFVGSINLKNLNGMLNQEQIKNGKAKLEKKQDYYKINEANMDIGRGTLDLKGYYFNNSYDFELKLQNIKIDKLAKRDDIEGIVNFDGEVQKKNKNIKFNGKLETNDLKFKDKIKIANTSSELSYKDNLNIKFKFKDLTYENSGIFEKGELRLVYDPNKKRLRTSESNLYIENENKISFNLEAFKEGNDWIFDNIKNKISLYGDDYFFTVDTLRFNKKKLSLKDLKIKSNDSFFVLNLETYYSLLKTDLDIKSNINLSIIKKYFETFDELRGNADLNFTYKTIDNQNKQSRLQLNIPSLTVNTDQLENVHYSDIQLAGKLRKNSFILENSHFYVDRVKNMIKGDMDFNIDKYKFKLENFNIQVVLNKMYSSYLVNPLLDNLGVIDGYFKGPLNITYNDEIKINGNLEVFDTNLIVYSFGNLYVNDISGTASIKNNYLKIDKLTGKSENNNNIELFGYYSDIRRVSDYKITLKLNKIYVPKLWYFDGWLVGNIFFEGDENRSSISGNLKINKGLIDAGFKELIGTGQGSYDLNKSLNLHFVSDNDLWIKNDIANIEFESDIYYKNDFESNKIYMAGQLEAIKGNIQYLTVQFNIKRCIINFPNSPEDTPQIDLLAETYVFHNGKKTINLYLNGDINSPNVELTSDDPNLSQNDIVSLLLFNYTSEEIEQRNILDRKAGEIATHFLQKGLLQPIKSSSALDILNVRGNLLSDEERYLDIEVGKYINEDFYILYRDEYMKTERRTLNFIFYLNDNLSLESGAIEEEGDLKYNIDLRLRFKY